MSGQIIAPVRKSGSRMHMPPVRKSGSSEVFLAGMGVEIGVVGVLEC